MGKTKLALRAGRESARQYPDGVWFVELAPIQDPELVPQAVFTALGLQDHSSSWAVSTLGDYLADKRPLLILDNCEHVHEAAAALAGTLLRACPDVRILATSRQALGVTGEVVVDVPTLSLPEDGDASPEALLRSDAVALFVERASGRPAGLRRRRRERRRDPEHLHAMSTASRSPSSWRRSGSAPSASTALDRGLAARLGALGTGDRSASPRQQTLEGAIDWSYQLLSEPERLAVGAPVGVRRRLRARRGAGGVCRRRPRRRGHPGARRVARRASRWSSADREAAATASGSSSRSASSAANGFGTRATRQRCARATETGSATRHRSPARTMPARSSCSHRIRTERANLWAALDVLSS